MSSMIKKKLCLVIPSLQVGGMERVMSELALYFCRKEDLEVHMVLYGIRPEIFYELPHNLTIHKPSFIFSNRERFWYTLKTMKFLRDTIISLSPASILSFGEYWNSLVLISVWGLPYPVYVSDRCSPDKKLNKVHSLLRKWLYPHSKGIIAQTSIAKQFYNTQFGNINICVIGNPIKASKGFENLNKNENYVLTVGRLVASKNYDKLIELFCKINHPDWKLIIVGGDALKERNMSKLENLINLLGFTSRVILTGYQNDLTKYYQQSAIFAFSSESEGFPNVIGEAMSSGLPVVSFDCVAGPSEMITDGEDGFLIPVNDYSLFRRRLEQLMNNEQLRHKMGLKAKESIQKFSSASIGARYYDFIIAS